MTIGPSELTQSQASVRRVPMCLPVGLGEGWRDAWCLSLGRAGIELNAARVGAGEPRVGDPLNVWVLLPNAVATLGLTSRVHRVQRRAANSGAETYVIGASFEGLGLAERELVDECVDAFRQRVCILPCGPVDLSCLDELREDHQLHEVRSVEEVFEGPTCSVLLLAATDRNSSLRALSALDGLRQWQAPMAWLRGFSLHPRIVLSSELEPTQLLALYGEGKIFRAVPAHDADALQRAVSSAMDDFRLHLDLQRQALPGLATLPGAEQTISPSAPDELVHRSQAMAEVLQLVRRAAAHHVPVLLTGETGTGKELLARAVHAMSPRATGPFVVQDCGTLVDTVLESELFGHVKGAFTGAVSTHPGLFVRAEGGTVFLDEIENLSPVFQAKLLRVLETGELRPVGGRALRRVDVRIIAASNRNLRQEMAAGRFRSDLFYRLDRCSIEVPPLRERREDILPIASHFLSKLATELGSHTPTLDPEAGALLLAHSWPGNVRELRNVVERALLLGEPEPQLTSRALPKELRSMPQPESVGLRARLAGLERQLIREALLRHQGVLGRAARELDMDAGTLARRARRLGIWPL